MTDTALRLALVRMTNAQNESCHAVDENVTLSALAEGVRFYKDFLCNYPDESHPPCPKRAGGSL